MTNILFFNRFEVKTPDFDPNPEKSKTNNHKWRKCLFLVFKDKSGNEFFYMPKWDAFETMQHMKESIEKINSSLAKLNRMNEEDNKNE